MFIIIFHFSDIKMQKKKMKNIYKSLDNLLNLLTIMLLNLYIYEILI